MKWCPNIECECVAEKSDYTLDTIVKCQCGKAFCFYCVTEDHMPANCAHVEMWRDKEKNDGENVNWMNANTKKCPRCKYHIEKNKGCNQMKCSNCKYVFCWLCLKDWS